LKVSTAADKIPLLSEKEDRCKRIADRRYDKPSAYKSGAIVRCRQGKIWKDLKEEIEDPTIECKKCDHSWKVSQSDPSDLYVCHECGFDNSNNYNNDLKEGLEDTSWTGSDGKKITLQQLLDAIKDYPVIQAPIEKVEKIIIKKDTGGIESDRLSAADVKYPIIIVIDDNKNYKYVLDGNHRANKAIDAGLKSIPAKLVNIKKLPQEFQDVLNESESLHKWFSRQGGEGKSRGWVDCNTCKEDPKTGRKKCKPCGRQKGEDRAKYPACRPTPSQCSRKGKGKTWGKTK
jgi:hypothetical protein